MKKLLDVLKLGAATVTIGMYTLAANAAIFDPAGDIVDESIEFATGPLGVFLILAAILTFIFMWMMDHFVKGFMLAVFLFMGGALLGGVEEIASGLGLG